MKCERCGFFIEVENYTDLIRIEEHHNPPQFMMEQWEGELITLCRDCHIEKLHPKILEIIQKHSNLLSKKNKGAYWIWKYHVFGEKRKLCLDEVIQYTKQWVKMEEKKEDGDTNTII